MIATAMFKKWVSFAACAMLVLTAASAHAVPTLQITDGTSSALTEITVSFKLDPQLTKAVYMGDRWVSPPTFTGVREGKEFTVDARAHGLDAKGMSVKINPAWMPEDADIVSVTPGQGNEVRITIRKAGRSSVKVVHEEVSKILFIKATQQNNIFNVEISQ